MPSPTRASVLRVVLPLGLPLLIGFWGGPAAAAPGCTLTSFDPLIDFGAMRPSAGSGETEIKPSPQRRTFSAVCPDATQMSLVFQGDARGAAEMRFGERGAYGIRVASARLDGAAVQMARLPAPEQPPAEESSGELTLLPSDVFAPASGRQLLSGKRLDITLEIAPVIPADAVRVNAPVTLDATAQLRLVTP
jgi:hypothetical protein